MLKKISFTQSGKTRKAEVREVYPFARLMEVMDRERVTVASAVGVRAVTAREWLMLANNADGENLHKAIHNQHGYWRINAPPILSHRFVTEEILMSLAPIASLGNHN